MDYVNLPLGLRVQTQIPLDVKEYSLSEEDLSDLGVNSNLAYTYTQGLIVYCVLEGTRWEWREVVGAETGGLLTTPFTYPSDVSTFGIDYSNRIFNFFPSSITPDGSETKLTAGANILISGNGTISTPYLISSPSTIVPDATSSVKGILKLTNDLGGTADLPTTPTALHKTGDETFIGVKSSTNTTSSPENAGLRLTNSGGANTFVFGLTNNAGSTTGMSVTNHGTYGINMISDGVVGIRINPKLASIGLNIDSDAGGTGHNLQVDLAGSGNAINIIDPDNVGTGNVLRATKNNIQYLLINNIGEITANKFIKAGGSSTQYLMADGSVTSTGGAVKSKIIFIPTPLMNHGYNVATGILDGTTLISVTPSLRCTTFNNGYTVGYIATVGGPQANDTGGLTDSGIGIRYVDNNVSEIVVTTNFAVDINSDYPGLVGTDGAIGDPIRLSSLANWSIRLVIIYI